MTRSKLLVMAFMVILVLTSITAQAASAETLPNILPMGTPEHELTFSSSSTGAAFGSGGLTEVTSASSLGESASEGNEGNRGGFHETYSGVKNPLLGTCTGTADAVGVVLVLGKYQLRDADLAGKLIVAVLFLLNGLVQFLCGTTSISMEGCVAGNLTPPAELTALLTIKLNRVVNDDEITSYLSSTGLPEFCLLLAKVGVGSTELLAENQAVDLSNFKQNGGAPAVLVMEL
jgi:hypothetical protein